MRGKFDRLEQLSQDPQSVLELMIIGSRAVMRVWQGKTMAWYRSVKATSLQWEKIHAWFPGARLVHTLDTSTPASFSVCFSLSPESDLVRCEEAMLALLYAEGAVPSLLVELPGKHLQLSVLTENPEKNDELRQKLAEVGRKHSLSLIEDGKS